MKDADQEVDLTNMNFNESDIDQRVSQTTYFKYSRNNFICFIVYIILGAPRRTIEIKNFAEKIYKGKKSCKRLENCLGRKLFQSAVLRVRKVDQG